MQMMKISRIFRDTFPYFGFRIVGGVQIAVGVLMIILGSADVALYINNGDFLTKTTDSHNLHHILTTAAIPTWCGLWFIVTGSIGCCIGNGRKVITALQYTKRVFCGLSILSAVIFVPVCLAAEIIIVIKRMTMNTEFIDMLLPLTTAFLALVETVFAIISVSICICSPDRYLTQTRVHRLMEEDELETASEKIVPERENTDLPPIRKTIGTTQIQPSNHIPQTTIGFPQSGNIYSISQNQPWFYPFPLIQPQQMCSGHVQSHNHQPCACQQHQCEHSLDSQVIKLLQESIARQAEFIHADGDEQRMNIRKTSSSKRTYNKQPKQTTHREIRRRAPPDDDDSESKIQQLQDDVMLHDVELQAKINKTQKHHDDDLFQHVQVHSKPRKIIKERDEEPHRETYRSKDTQPRSEYIEVQKNQRPESADSMMSVASSTPSNGSYQVLKRLALPQ